jgi:hypothetical protein
MYLYKYPQVDRMKLPCYNSSKYSLKGAGDVANEKKLSENVGLSFFDFLLHINRKKARPKSQSHIVLSFDRSSALIAES